MKDADRIHWIQTGIVAGLCASVIYPVVLFVPLSLAATATLAAFLGPTIGIGSLGLRHLITVDGRPVAAALGAISNVVAGAMLTAMLLVQLAVRHAIPDTAATGHLVGIWLGLDVAWDIYIGLGTVFFSAAMRRHPRFGWSFALPGLLLGLLVIALNLYTFPTPPAEAGYVDVGPFVGLWYLAATVRAWGSIGWAREKLELIK